LADLQSDEDQAYRKIRLRAEDVQGRNVLTNFWVMMSGSVCTVTIYVVHCAHLHVVRYVAN
jgi:hypothetical protein